jgi:hypothetical protein
MKLSLKIVLLGSAAVAALGMMGAMMDVATRKDRVAPQAPVVAQVGGYTKDQVKAEIKAKCGHIDTVWVHDYATCVDPIAKRMLDLETAPTDEARWSTDDLEWNCPADDEATIWVSCSSKIPTKADRHKVTLLWSCVARSGKEEHTLGYDWALAECQNNNEAF